VGRRHRQSCTKFSGDYHLPSGAPSKKSSDSNGAHNAFQATVHDKTATCAACASASKHRGTLQTEEGALKAGRVQVADGGANYPVWNHWEYRVAYKSLSQQLMIGGIYVKLLMDGLDQVPPPPPPPALL